VLEELLPRLAGWRLAPLVLALHARVALGDRVAEALGASAVLILIGERPGLSAPDSLGAYLTWAPNPATTDANRNCVSNIRPEGLGYAEAAFRLAFLLERMRALGRSGLALKDESDAPLISRSPA
jgi:ethanolamine ammonia-lyase small subunit